MAAAPLVSVIVPCHNHGAYLEEAVDSALQQTYPRVEVVIVDDGSQDPATLDLLNSHPWPSQVRVFFIPGQGPSVARNVAITQAQGEYILPLDADDKIAPTYIEKALAVFIADPQVGIVYCRAQFFGGREGEWPLPEFAFPDILLGNTIFNCSLFRRSDWQNVGGYNPNMVWGWEDYDLWLSLLEAGVRVWRIPEVLHFKRYIPESRGSTLDSRREHLLKTYHQLFNNHRQLYLDHIDTLLGGVLKLWETGDLLATTQQQLATTQQQLATTQHQLHLAQAQVDAMASSKFWRLREGWFRLKALWGSTLEG